MKLEIKDYNGASINIERYGNNLVLLNPKCDILIDKESAKLIIDFLAKNFDVKKTHKKPDIMRDEDGYYIGQ